MILKANLDGVPIGEDEDIGAIADILLKADRILIDGGVELNVEINVNTTKIIFEEEDKE